MSGPHAVPGVDVCVMCDSEKAESFYEIMEEPRTFYGLCSACRRSDLGLSEELTRGDVRVLTPEESTVLLVIES